ncbi:MAG: MCE family protein [Zetaproteobacteria bacterium]|nr:MAG: MCE family protein [Zetaproteobacteria bacterium]
MSDADRHPAPEVKPRRSLSLVWLVPLVTLIIGGWLIFKSVHDKGPVITITFKTAEGIEPGKTRIKFKDVEVGKVTAVRFSEDYRSVTLTAQMEKESGVLLKRSTRFWVVKPRLSLRGVSGLSTLVSGAYIALDPGEGRFQTHFQGLEKPPLVKGDTPGVRVELVAQKLGSLDAGSPIYYRGLRAGEVLGYELGNDNKSIFIHAFVHKPFDALVHSNSKFWNVSGIDVSMGADGFKVHSESMLSLLYGGIAFETPQAGKKSNEKIDGVLFTLYENHEKVVEHGFTRKMKFVAFFDSSVRGLAPGAPVEFKGIKVGQVTDLRLEFNMKDATFRIPVLLEIEPERVVPIGGTRNASPYQTFRKLVEKGLRAQLETGNLLTGKLFVALDMHPGTPVRLVGAIKEIPEMPTIPGGFAQLTASAKKILDKLEKVETDKIGAELLSILQGINGVVKRPEVQQTVTDLRASIASLRSILAKVDRHTEPIAGNLDELLASGHAVLAKARHTLDLINAMARPDAPLQYKLIRLSDDLSEAARALRGFLDLLERHPNSILFGKE